MSDRPGLTSPDKVLWPAPGITKAELYDYWTAVADRFLRTSGERALTLVRHPDGVGRPGFVQKHVADAPAHLRTTRVWSASSRRHVEHLVGGPEELRWAAQMAAVELHAWLTRVDRPDRPDRLLLDLDPADDGRSVVRAARWTREVLDELGLSSRVMSSGRRGLHVVVPIERRYHHTQVRGLALALARCIADRHPDALTVEMRRADRGGRLLLDWSRHGAAQHAVAAWSPRATPTATVAVPLAWDELDRVDRAGVTVRTALDRPDPWASPVRAHRLERVRDELVARGYEPVDRSPRARTTPRRGRPTGG